MSPRFMERVIIRKCIVCGKRLRITVEPNGHYSGGYYFGVVEFPIGKGEHKKIGTTKIFDKKIEVVEWTGRHEKIEYWECDACFNEEDE